MNKKHDDAIKAYTDALKTMPRDVAAQRALQEAQDAQRAAIGATKTDSKLTGKWSGKYTAGLLSMEATSMELMEGKEGSFSGTWTDRDGIFKIEGVRTGNKMAFSLKWQSPKVGPVVTFVSGDISSEGKTLTIKYNASWKEGNKTKTDQGGATLKCDEPNAIPKQTDSKSASELKKVMLLAISSHPEKFDGQTLVVRGDLFGTCYDGKGRYRLTVRGQHTFVDGSTLRSDGINFILPTEQKERLMGSMKSDQFYPVAMTVSVRQGPGGRWLAEVSEIKREDR
jgi:hypothetical protein